ncbi:MAG: response regulator transcription factor [Deltaproteobacteria bacterium]|nr:response regulator transcription factor [Deltaproteobacteria bacterium]MBW2071007.1 response regulator transcription factor [Deltaproteobacteria bacterium]
MVGPSAVQNELIAQCIKRETGVRCLVKKEISQVIAAEKEEGEYALVLLDSQGKDMEQLLTDLRTLAAQDSTRYEMVLFNVSSELENEERCVWEGVRGLIYQHDPTDHFVKGVCRVLEGEMWVSRGIMAKCITEGKSGHDPTRKGLTLLTPRQEEILALVAIGATNEQIAEKLCISPHTVKTHLYNIFKKIKVPNRLQAAFWAAKNL